MKKIWALAAALFVISLSFVSCQKDINPFSPQIDEKEEAENSTSGRVAAARLKPPAQVSTTATTGNQERRRFRNRESPSSEGGMAAEIQPSRWNTSWVHSQGLVTVRVYGPGFEAIDPSTLRMVGPEGDQTSEPLFSQTGPFFAMAKFAKSEAIGLIPDPQPGQIYDILITWGNGSGGESGGEFSYPIRIVGREWPTGELTLDIRPDKWNPAWLNDGDEDEDDVVTARISGRGYRSIDPTSIQMDYPAGGKGPISPLPGSFELGGVALVVKFAQKEAIGLIPDPDRGETYEILVTGKFEDGTTFELGDTIEIIGKKSGQGPLTLEIRPDAWNLAWLNDGDEDEDDVVTARISGEDFDKIEVSPTKPFLMGGPAGTPIHPVSTGLGGFFFQAKFSQSQAITLIPNPPTESKYEIWVSFYLEDGTSQRLSAWVTVKGKRV